MRKSQENKGQKTVNEVTNDKTSVYDVTKNQTYIDAENLVNVGNFGRYVRNGHSYMARDEKVTREQKPMNYANENQGFVNDGLGHQQTKEAYRKKFNKKGRKNH